MKSTPSHKAPDDPFARASSYFKGRQSPLALGKTTPYFKGQKPAFVTQFGAVYLNPRDHAKPGGLNLGHLLGGAGHGLSVAYEAAGRAGNAEHHYVERALTKRHKLPNPSFFTGPLNVLYGESRIIAGTTLLTVGTAEDVTGIGALVGLPTQAAGAYLLTTGVARTARGIRQSEQAIRHPTVKKSPARYGADLVIEVAPGGGAVNFFGGLP